MSTFNTLLTRVRENDALRQQYLEVCRDLLNQVIFDITSDVNRCDGVIHVHKDGSGDETVAGCMRMHVELELPAPLTFDFFTTHIHTWVGVRPLSNGQFQFSMAELPEGIALDTSKEAVSTFFQQLLLTDDLKLASFTGKEQPLALVVQ